MDATVADILEENAARRAELFADYDPRTGKGSPIERVEVPLTPTDTVNVPTSMDGLRCIEQIREAGSVEEWATDRGIDPTVAKAEFQELRCQYDFEFWCSMAATIELDAETREERDADFAPLVMNRAQRTYWKEIYDQWSAGDPVRIILLKARQWGGSTLTQAFFAWVQRYHRDAWNSFVCNLTLDQARNIRDMYETLADEYPSELGTITLAPYQGSSNQRQIQETRSIVGITTIENPDSPRSYDIHLAHLSEVGLWPSTPEVNAEDFAGAITGAVSNVAGTVIIEESTARGVGTYFHTHWQDAGEGRSSYAQVFIAWHDIPAYTRDIEDTAAFVRERLRPSVEDNDDLAEQTETARRLWRLGATLEGIRWYFEMLQDFKGDIRRMQSEYPSTPREAFQSTGRRYFSLDLTAKIREQTVDSRKTGRLTAEGVEGEEAFEEIELRQAGGDDPPLKVWRRPSTKVWWDGELLNPDAATIKGRYCAFADFGGKSKDADWSVITVADRIKMLRGGPMEVAARLRVHMRPDLFAWASARLAYWYDEALLAYEINRHRKNRGDDVRGYEPEWSLAVIEEVMDAYDNLYLREVQDRIDEPVRYEVGFHTNSSTKPLIYNTLEASLSETPGGQTYFDPDRAFVNELDTFERKEDGSIGAVEGNHDDIVDTSAGVAWLGLKHMDAPIRVHGNGRAKRGAPDAATF